RVGASSVDELLLLADVARESGHPEEAAEPLRRVLSSFASDPQAALAALTLGKLELETLHRHLAAAAAFERAIELGLPAALQEQAYARRVEALARAGDRDAARRAAEEYRARFPAGRYLSNVDQWAAP